MLKRTKGYVLLTMLVLTGLAGRMHSNILTTKERHTLVTELKSSRNNFLKNVEGLSTKQLNFKAGRKDLSIKDCMIRLVSIENNLWMATQRSLKDQTAFTDKTFSDEILPTVLQQEHTFPNTIKFISTKEALKFYKYQRAEILRYVHTSTENVRGYGANMNSSNFDCYQLILLTTIYCKYYTEQIEKIKVHPRFPNKKQD